MKKRISRYYMRCTVLILYIIAVCLLCFINLGDGLDMQAEWFGIPKDKVAHFMMFLPYPILMTLVFCRRGWTTSRFILFLAATVLTGALAGGTIELLQGLSGYRSCDIMDFRADCLGIFTGAVLTVIGKTMYGNRKKDASSTGNLPNRDVK